MSSEVAGSDPNLASEPLRVTFLTEQHVGHRSFSANLRRFVEPDPRIDALWVDVTYTDENNRLEALPLPDSVAGSIVGRNQVRRGLKARPYDVAFFNTQVPAVIAAPFLPKKPYVLSMDITPIQLDEMADHYGHTPDSGGAVAKIKHQANRKVFGGAERILAWSTWVQESLVADYGVERDNIDVWAPGIDIDLWKPAPENRSPEGFKILFVGGDFERKGGLELIEAYAQLDIPGLELHIVSKVTEAEVAHLDNVHLHPEIVSSNDPVHVALAQSCHAFVLPTHAEALGLALIEGSSCGLPVVATNVGGLSDVAIDGETGIVVPPGDAGAVAKAISRLAEDRELANRLGENGRRNVERRFSAPRQVGRAVDILHRCAGRHPG